jgi:hypothetical protein
MLVTIVFISLMIIGDPADDLDRSKAGPSKAKHRQATTSFTTPLGALSASSRVCLVFDRRNRALRLTVKVNKNRFSFSTNLHSLATMPGRLPTTKDFPSTVKLSIVPRKYVSHSATPSLSSL